MLRMPERHYPRVNHTSSCSNCFTHFCASLSEKEYDKEDRPSVCFNSLVLQRYSLAALIVCLVMKTLRNNWWGSY